MATSGTTQPTQPRARDAGASQTAGTDWNQQSAAGSSSGIGDELRQGQPGLASYVTRAADEIDRWTSRLREQDLEDAVREVQEFARRKPAIFLGVAFGAGVLAARFFKSSPSRGVI